jgi:hypothetical protein
MAHATPTARAVPRSVLVLGAAIAVELLLLGGYFMVTPATVTRPRYVLYPFVWINVVLWAALRTRPGPTTGRARLVGAVVAIGYFLLLANWSGLVGLTVTGHHPIAEAQLGLHIGSGSPGWERVRLLTRAFYVSFVPFRVIGYVGLAYLVYAAVADATSAALSGAIGLFSCLSCSFPIAASMVTSVYGGSLTLVSTVVAYSVDLATGAFLLSVALLYWRPGFPGNGDDPT